MRHLVDTIYAGDALHGGLQLAERVYREVDVAYRYAVDILRRERRHREVELIRDAIYKVAHKVVAVDALHADANGVEEDLVLLEVHRRDRVAMLRGEAYRRRAVALMKHNRALGILEANDLVTRERQAVRATLILQAREVGKIAA